MTRNYVKASKIYEKCLRAGTWHSSFYKALYGLRLIQGLGVEKDEARGKSLVLDSIKYDNAIAWFVLEECHRYG